MGWKLISKEDNRYDFRELAIVDYTELKMGLGIECREVKKKCDGREEEEC